MRVLGKKHAIHGLNHVKQSHAADALLDDGRRGMHSKEPARPSEDDEARFRKGDKTRIFKNVKTKYVTSRSEGGRDVADFEINCIVSAGLSNEK